MSFQNRLLLSIGILFFLSFLGLGAVTYQRVSEQAEDHLKEQAERVRSVLMSTRRVYHRQFMDSGIELTEKTLGFLPAYAMNRISEDFVESWDKTGFRFNNVSDKPRNPRQKADANELVAMNFFRSNPKEEVYYQRIEEQGRPYLLYARPIWIEEYCLKCHGPRETAPQAIQKLYQTAFDYKLGELRGVLSIKVPADALKQHIWEGMRDYMVGTAAVILIMYVVLTLLVRRYIKRPVSHFISHVHAVSHGYEAGHLPAMEGEFTQLSRDFNRMVDELGQRTQERDQAEANLRATLASQEKKIAERTQQLSRKVAELEETRNELVQSEKMASLGRLVAGFAHELNTPVGVAIGSISHTGLAFKTLKDMARQDEVDEASLMAVIRDMEEGLNLTETSLFKAAALVRSFKRTSVDQTSDIVRRYNLHESIGDVISSLHNKFKRSSIQFRVACPDDLEAWGSPGALDQILTNLIENSFLHGFANGTRSGIIGIGLELRQADSPEAARIVLHYTDDGAGIQTDMINRIFEPFFTTNREHGGSGLGLYIVYNLATTRLGGSISCHSQPGAGVCFELMFPQNLHLSSPPSA